MRVLFWNIHDNSIAGYVARCAAEHEADIVCLAEHHKTDPNDLCQKLGSSYRWICGPNDSRGKKVILFARNTVRGVPSGPLLEQERYVVWTFECSGKTYNIIALHMISKKSEPDSYVRTYDAERIVANLRLRERQTACANSIVIGDFNANPFDPELIAKNSFNATLFKDVLQSQPIRRRGDDEFLLMYNPVLHYLSEETKCYGSYYYGEGFACLFWHCLDQALVSPALADSVEDFQYLRSIEGEMLINKVRPNDSISDHLPLLLTIRSD